LTGKEGSLKEDSLEIIYNAVIRRFELEIDRKKELDNKANNLVGFIGIIASLITGFGGTYLKIPNIEEWNLNSLRLLSPIVSFAFVLMFMLFSLIFVFQAIQIKQLTYVPHAFNLIGAYSNTEKLTIIQHLCDEYAVAIGDNSVVNDRKANNIKKAIWSLSLGLFTLVLHAFLLLI